MYLDVWSTDAGNVLFYEERTTKQQEWDVQWNQPRNYMVDDTIPQRVREGAGAGPTARPFFQ